MKGSTGRRESTAYRMAMYVVLVLGALPVLLPVYWMLLSSLTSRERVAANPPDWVPLDVRHSISVADQPVRVTIFDDASTSGTGVYRVKMRRDAAQKLLLPRARIDTEVREESFATIDGRKRRVEPLGPTDGADSVTVSLPGTRRQVRLHADSVQTTTELQTFWTVLGVEIPVKQTADDPELVAFEQDSPPIRISPELFENGEPGSVLWAGRRLPARIIAPTTPAGYLTVQLIAPPEGLRVPVGELREQTRVRHVSTIDGTLRDVKPMGREAGTEGIDQSRARKEAASPREAQPLPDGRGSERAPVQLVEVLGEPQCMTLPASDIRTETQSVHYATVLGERRIVEPLNTPLPKDPSAQVAVFVPGAIAVAGPLISEQREVRPRWDNFSRAWQEQSFDLYIANTMFIAALVVLGTILSCGLVGYAFARLEFRGRDWLFMLLLATMMIPGQVTSIPQFVLFVKLGWIDTYKPLIVPHFLAHSAFFVFLFRQFLLTIPDDLEDAARIDGCGPLATWWLVMMPLSKPIIVTVAVFSSTYVWNDFLTPLLYINSDEKQTVALGLQSFKSAYSANEPQLMMAASVMMIVPTVLLFFLAQKAFMRGVVVSGVKG